MYFRFDDFSQFRAFYFGVVLYLFISFIRGFIYIAVSLLINIISNNTIILILAMLPVLFLFVPRTYKMIWLKLFPYLFVLWMLSVIIPIIQVQILFVSIGLILVYGMIRWIYLEHLDKTPRSSIFYVPMWMLALDLLIRSLNRGVDPQIHSYPFVYFVVIIITICFYFFIVANKDHLQVISDSPKHQIIDVKTIFARNLSIFGTFLNLLVYLIYFANPGVLTSALGVNSKTATSVLFFSILLILSLIQLKIKYLMEKYPIYLQLITSITLVSSILLFPWYKWNVIFMLCGIFSWIILFMSTLYYADGVDDHQSMSISFSISFGIIFIIIILYQMLVVESIILHIIIVGLTAISAILPPYFQNKKGNN